MQQEWVNGTITISVSGVPLEMRKTLPARPVKPSRMLPVLRAVTDSYRSNGRRSRREPGRSGFPR
jgi:sulfite reductase beta subunit-like hemoprotein